MSYGSCQFPTLGFVVERYKAIKDFIEEDFWKLEVTHRRDEANVEFSWCRGRLFDKNVVQVKYKFLVFLFFILLDVRFLLFS